MNMSFDPTKTQSATPTTSTAVLGSNLGNIAGGDADKTLPNLTTMQAQAKPGAFFGASLGGTSAPTFGSNLNLGIGSPQVNPMSTPATTLGLTNASSAPNTALSFGMTTSTPMPGFGTSTARATAISFGTPTKVTATSASSLGMNFGMTHSTPVTGFNLTAPQPQTTGTAAPGMNFGVSTALTSTVTGFSLGGTTTTTSAPTGINFGLTPAGTSSLAATTTSTGLTLGSVASTAPVGFNPPTAASAPGTTSTFSLSSTAPATTTTLGTFSLPGTTSTLTTAATAASAVASTGAPQTSLGTVTTVSSSASSGQIGTMNFCQLDETINKWTLELEEQEKVFMNQATQINAWDKLLIANGEKIVTLNQEVERVKLEQQQLEHELDYVVGQQKELQDCLVPLEKELASISVSDPEREYTYRLAEKLDTQLKQMSEDLKEIIEHLNEANRSQDSSDPIVQIGKILNAHMNSLQWIDTKTSILGQKIQQIDQMHQNFRQENERSFSLAYN